jgi:outer membrane protein assembly factor BamB
MSENRISRRTVLNGLGSLCFIKLTGNVKAQQTNDIVQWHQHRNDIQNSGYASGKNGLEGDVTVKWSKQHTVWGPLVHDDSLFIAGGDIYKYDSEDVSELWQFESETGQFFTTPVYASGSVYAVDRSNTLYSISAETGDENWQLDLPFSSGDFVFRSSPQYHDGIIYIRINNDDVTRVFAVNVDNQELRWQTELPGYGGDSRIRSSPAINNGTVYVGSNALNAQNGNIEWSTRDAEVEITFNEYYTVNSVSVSNNRVFTGYDGGVHAFDADTGQLEWSFGEEVGMSLRGTPAVAEETVYYGRNVNTADSPEEEFDIEGEVVALDAETGNQIWRFETNGQINGSVIATGDIVYVGDSEHILYAIDAATGDELWQFDQTGVNDSYPNNTKLTQIAIGDETLYIGTHNSLYTLEAGSVSGSTALFRQFGGDSALPVTLIGGGVLGGLGFGAYRWMNSKDDKSPAEQSTKDSSSSVNSDSKLTSDKANNSFPETTFQDYKQGDLIHVGTHMRAVRATVNGHLDEVVLYFADFENNKTIDTSVLDQIKQRLNAWSKMDDHRCLLTVYDLGETPVPWAAVEQADDTLLIDCVENFSITETLEALQQLCDALHHVQRYGTTYKNLTTESILHSRESVIKLQGILDQLHESDPWYNAPEEFGGESTEQSTVYRIGLIAYELLTGTLPYAEYPNGSAQVTIESSELISPSEQIEDLPSEIESILMKALSKSPDDRYETVLHLRDEFSALDMT